MIRQEHKEKFQKDLTAYEKAFFLGTARDAIRLKRYLASEDLFFYCYFMTIKERMKTVSSSGGSTMARILYVQAARDIEDALAIYIGRLEATKGPAPDTSGDKFIEYFSATE